MLNILMFHTKLVDEVKRIEEKYNVKIHLAATDNIPPKDILEQIDIVTGYLPKDIGKKLPNLKWMHLFSAGVERSIDYAIENNILLTNGKGTYGIGIAEHSLSLMLTVARQFDKAILDMPSGNWGRDINAREIYGSTVGIVGMGDIGTRLAYLCNCLGARVLSHKRTPSPAPSYIDKLFIGNDGLDEMLGMCDYVCICLPGTPKTRNLFDEARLLKIKHGSIIINIGRGSIINTDALVKLLKNGHIAGAGLDVTEPEPLPQDHELWTLPNVVITPHVAGSSNNVPFRILEVFEKNLYAYLRGTDMPTKVDLEERY